MGSIFIPVDLDQVLDEFEEQEKNDTSSAPLNRPNTLNLPENSPELKPHGVNEPRTYSFNSPLEAILKEQNNSADSAPRKSLAEELADLDFGGHAQNINDDDDVDYDDAIDEGSDASSITAVIAAAEKITERSDFHLQSTNGTGLYVNNVNSIDDNNSDLSAARCVAEPEEDETDFLSLLNSVVVDESPFSLKETKPAASTMGSTPEIDQLKDIKDSANLGNIENDSSNNTTNLKQILKDDLNMQINNDSDNSKSYNMDLPCSETSVGGMISNDLVNVSIDNDENQPKVVACSSSEMNESNIVITIQDKANTPTFDGTQSNHVSSGAASDSTTTIPNECNEISEVLQDSNKTFPTHDSALQDNNMVNIQDDADTQTFDDIQSHSLSDSAASESTVTIPNELNEISAVPHDGNKPFPTDDSPPSQDSNTLLDIEPIINGINGEEVCEAVNTNGDVSVTSLNAENGGDNFDGLLVNSSQANSDLHSVQNEDVGESEQPCGNDMPLLQDQTTDINCSADSLCGEVTVNDDAQALLPEGDRMSPTRTVSPESLADEGILPVHISSGDPEMGFVPPIWVPDEVASHCMTCGAKFSLIKRKHHCRACGRVLCSSCCNMKFPLPYMGNKDARVCQVCCDILIQNSQQHVITEDINEEIHVPTAQFNPLNPDASSNSDNIPVDEDMSVVMESAVSEDQSEQLLESANDVDDGLEIEDVNEAGPSDVEASPVLTLPTDTALPAQPSSASLISTPLSPALSDDSDMSFRLDVEHVRALIPQDSFTLPPVLNLKKKAIHIQEHPDPAEIMYRLKGLGETVIFLLNKNLIVKVKIVKLKCCVKKKCWCFVTDGMGAANQEEMVVLLECQHSENTVPKDVLSHFNTAFTYAKQGHVVSDLGFTIFGQPFLGSANNAGFLYIKPTFQCLENLPLPTIPYVIGILIQRQEAPWAQLFPIRLMLRLGTEFRYYPCPLWSVRNRPSVYNDIGHTIMNLLTDFKNFQYSIPRITGLVIHMENNKTSVRLPQDRFDEMVKVLNAAEEHMFAFGANFSGEADSHLVCIQEGDNYKTQAINIQNKPRKVTGASFVVFTGSLKTSNPNDAKVSIIEDGIMIQMLPDAILELRKALREMQDYVITTGSNATANAVTQVDVEWVSRDTNKQSYISPIDGRCLTDVPSIQVHSSCDFSKRDIYRIRWTNVFLERNGSNSRGLSSRGLTRLTGELARACCEALRPYLQGLFDVNLTQLSLRVNIDADSVEYSIGANQKPLPTNLMADLDSALIPSINAAAMKYRRGPLTVELFFSVISLF